MIPKIAPSILSSDPSNFAETVAEMIHGGADWIHFDVMDGQFVPVITFGANLVSSLRKLGSTPFEAHLMTMTPEKHFQPFVDAGCQRIIFHTEATHHSHRLPQSLRSMGVQAGAAINPGTPIEALLPLLDVIDLALIMTVNPGWGGQKMIHSCCEKVRKLREIAPDLEIEVDGGVDPTTIRQLWDAGATTFVAGNYLVSGGTIKGNITELRETCALKF